RRKLRCAAVHAGYRIVAKLECDRVGRSAQAAQEMEIEIQPLVGGVQDAQSLHRRFGGQDQGKIPGRSQRILLEASKKERLVLANRASGCEAINVLAEDGLRRLIDFIYIGNRVETLRLKSPEQRAMQAVCARFGDHVENAAAGSAELDAKVARLHRNLFHGVRDIEGLRDTGVGDFIVFGA